MIQTQTYQTYEPLVGLIKTRIEAAKRSGQHRLSVKSIFQILRDNDRFSLFGDYPLMSITVEMVKDAGFQVSDKSVASLLKSSKEISDLEKATRDQLIEQLLS